MAGPLPGHTLQISKTQIEGPDPLQGKLSSVKYGSKGRTPPRASYLYISSIIRIITAGPLPGQAIYNNVHHNHILSNSRPDPSQGKLHTLKSRIPNYTLYHTPPTGTILIHNHYPPPRLSNHTSDLTFHPPPPRLNPQWESSKTRLVSKSQIFIDSQSMDPKTHQGHLQHAPRVS